VAAVNAAGFQGAYAFAPNLYAVPELQQPAQPASPSLTVVGGSSMQVQFGAAPASGGADVNFYRVEYANAAFAAEVQEVDALCVVTHEIQVSETPVPLSVEVCPYMSPRVPLTIGGASCCVFGVCDIQEVNTTTSHTIPETQLLYLYTSYGGTETTEKQQVVCDANGGYVSPPPAVSPSRTQSSYDISFVSRLRCVFSPLWQVVPAHVQRLHHGAHRVRRQRRADHRGLGATRHPVHAGGREGHLRRVAGPQPGVLQPPDVPQRLLHGGIHVDDAVQGHESGRQLAALDGHHEQVRDDTGHKYVLR